MDKILRFLEDHVEKMVLGAAVIIFVWLLVTRVVLSPNAVSYERRSYSPGAIDDSIRDEALKLEEIMNRRPNASDVYESRLPEYRELLRSSITGVDFGMSPLVPESNPQGGIIVRKYNLPDVGQVGEVAVGRIRAVAYTPFEEVTAENVYSSTNSEPNDLDLVTVQGAYDIPALYASFEDSFAGAGVKPEWRDPSLAEPVFAAVDLQRQKMDEDGVWGEWEDVPRTKIDNRRELFAVIEDAKSLPPGGLAVRMLQYSDRAVQSDLLQPAAYHIASANEEWFPPLLYDEYKAIRATQALEERRRAKEEEEKDSSSSDTGVRRASSTSGRRSLSDTGGRTASASDSLRTSSGRRTSRSGSTPAQGQSQGISRYGNRASRSRTGRDEAASSESQVEKREASSKPTVEDVRKKLKELSIESIAQLRGLNELVFWAHDDTVEPGGEYRYRVRLGIFNPIAGKNQLSQRDAARNNEVILWSGFSDASDPVKVPQRLYFFAKGIQEAAKEVTVQVSKFMLGYWYSEDFKVRGGEVIGDVVQKTESARKRNEPAGGIVPDASERADGVGEPEVVDYDTGAVLVDVVAVNDWSGDSTMRARQYFEMLYSYDGSHIERMAVGDRYWPDELRVIRSEIRDSQKEPKPADAGLRPWGSTERSAARVPSGRGLLDE
ncbi:MAG: hypothetical protein JXN61_01305 [Sedimentisphaerales bacterium]|nr:hypothetical protein [Sedimentisphaerales bacterium]